MFGFLAFIYILQFMVCIHSPSRSSILRPRMVLKLITYEYNVDLIFIVQAITQVLYYFALSIEEEEKIERRLFR
jgi:hypothetical protein